MKIRLLSDLHLEGYKHYYEYAGEDVVVLAGDIHTQGRHRFILDQIPSNVKILMVAGNHEYYGSSFERVNDFLYELQAEYPNFWFLNNEHVVIDGVHFFGGTMFTDMKLYGDSEEHVARSSIYAKQGIADFSWISKYNEPPADYDNEYFHQFEKAWTVADHIEQHNIYRTKLEEFLEKCALEKRVVISHFVPHPEGSDPIYKNSPLNPYFLCDMRKYMGWEGLWLYGHTHTSKDIMEGDTRLVCNPKGYGLENVNGFNKNLVLEI